MVSLNNEMENERKECLDNMFHEGKKKKGYFFYVLLLAFFSVNKHSSDATVVNSLYHHRFCFVLRKSLLHTHTEAWWSVVLRLLMAKNVATRIISLSCYILMMRAITKQFVWDLVRRVSYDETGDITLLEYVTLLERLQTYKTKKPEERLTLLGRGDFLLKRSLFVIDDTIIMNGISGDEFYIPPSKKKKTKK